MDPLSDVLALLNVEGALSARLEVGGTWAIRFPGYRHVRIGAVLSGSAWLAVDGVDTPVHLREGDCYLLADGLPYRLSSDREGEPVDARTVFTSTAACIVRHGSGDPDTVLIGGKVTFDDHNSGLLLDSLPPIVLVRGTSDLAHVLRSALEMLAYETASPRPASALMTGYLAHILFVQALRAHLGSLDAPSRGGWLSALADPQVGASLALMHEDVTRRWTVAELAAAVNMSRSSFAERFKTLVGLAPVDYLLQRRMQTAGQALRAGDRTVSAIAAESGYASDSAFSNAFKRVMGYPPSQYRKGAVRSD
ncbi:AraC family transcriptional regulator [Streptomyces sp. NPDC020951]|uniref:AraC family transcriptional regulator n=1 Tax=Streptomyces sp. NPDC020951 TaxID=3365104 RepID=UPI0037AAE022